MSRGEALDGSGTKARAASATAQLESSPGVVRRGSRLALDGPPVTRVEAMRADVRLVRAALDAAEIAYLLVRGDDDRPVLAVDRSSRQQLEAALADAFATEPFYARVDGASKRSERLLALGELPGDDATLFLLYRRRTRTTRAAWRASQAATRLELWSFGDLELHAPRENALTRRAIPRRDAVLTSVRRDDEDWPTLVGMFDDHTDDVELDVDIVFSWVDGSDPATIAERRRWMPHQLAAADASPARFRQIDELRYALRSIEAFAPWIRRIFIATDSTPPAWLDAEHPRVTIMRSEDFFADPRVLPTFNSHAIEAQLHRIPGLSEHFLYSNDDMFFGRPVTPGMFFSPGGITRFVEATTRIGLGEADPERAGHDNAMRVNRALLRDRFGRTITRHLEHCATPLRKSVLAELEQEFPAEFERTAASRFRSSTDISVTNSLYHYYALLTGKAVTQPLARVAYVETTLHDTTARLRRIERRRPADMFCLNDGSEPELPEETRVSVVSDFLQRYFPVPGPWERGSA